MTARTRIIAGLFAASMVLGMAAPAPVPFTTTSFGAANAYFSGRWTGSVGPAQIQANGIGSTCEFTATGTACTVNEIMNNSGGAECEASVDGGAFFNLVPTAYGFGTGNTAPIFSGLADAAHTVIIRDKVGSFFGFAPNGGVGSNLTLGIINVTGAAPACAPPSGFTSASNYLLGTTTNDTPGQIGANAKIQLESGFVLTADASQGYSSIPKMTNYLLGSDGAVSINQAGGQIRFRATTTRIDAWAKNTGQAYILVVDGVIPASRVKTSADGKWAWNLSWTGLDGTTEHTYGILHSSFVPSQASLGDSEVWSIRTPGGTFNTTAAPTLRSTILYFGDSITSGQNELTAGPAGADERDASNGWVIRTSERLNCQFYNAGIGSTTTHDFTGHTGALTGQDISLVTVWSGETRATHDAVSPVTTPPKIVLMYGRNDVGNSGYKLGTGTPVETSTQFDTSFTAMMSTINTGQAAADVYIIGILPATAGNYNGGTTETDRQAFNTKIVNRLATIGNAKNHYINPDTWGFNGVPGDNTGTDFVLTTLDGLHPGRFGRYLVHEGLYTGITGTKTLGIVPVRVTNPLQTPPYPSQPTVLRVAGNGGTTFTTSHAMTASAGVLGSPTVSSDTYLTVPWTPPSTPQRVTFTETGSGATTYLDVVVPTLTISPTSAAPNASVTVTLTAPFTAWTATTGGPPPTTNPTLFTSPGVVLTGALVPQFGTATITFTTPNTPGGSVVITDTSTSQTATLTLTGSAQSPVPVINGGFRRRTSIAPGPHTPFLDLLDPKRQRRKVA